MTLQPLFNHLLIKVPEREEQSEGGIVIPDSASHDRPETGEVIAKGPLADAVEVGDKVVFKRYSPETVKIGAETFTLVAQEDLIAKYV